MCHSNKLDKPLTYCEFHAMSMMEEKVCLYNYFLALAETVCTCSNMAN